MKLALLIVALVLCTASCEEVSRAAVSSTAQGPTTITSSVCPAGVPYYNCFVNPCVYTTCPGGCQANYCGGCNAICLCNSDSDCPAGNWCRAGSCAAFVTEGQSCGGFTLPQYQQRCAPGLICASENNQIVDLPGICRRPCCSTIPCGDKYYCSSQNLCRPDGSCFNSTDCTMPGNNFVQTSNAICIMSYFTCNNNQCVKRCRQLPVAAATVGPVAVPTFGPGVVLPGDAVQATEASADATASASTRVTVEEVESSEQMAVPAPQPVPVILENSEVPALN